MAGMVNHSNRDLPLGIAQVLQAGPCTIEYFDCGSGPAVVILPALAGRLIEFHSLIETLNAAGYRTLAVHLPGIGRSHCPFREQPTLHTFADAIQSVVQQATGSADAPVCLVGRGLGNRIARTFATRYRQQTRGLVLLAAGGKHRSRQTASLLLRYFLLQVPGLPIGLRRRIMESIMCVRRNVLPESVCRRAPLRAFLMQAKASRRTPVQEWWSAGIAPMLVLQGAEDRVSPLANSQSLVDEYPDRVELKVLPHAGHALTYDVPDVVNREVLRFVSETLPTPVTDPESASTARRQR